MIEPIVNQNIGNTFQHQNGPNQRQYIQKILVNSTNTKTLVNSINSYHIKYQGPHQLHTLKKTVFDVDSTQKA